MKKLIFVALALLAFAVTAIAGNVHTDGNDSPLQFFAPAKTRSVTHTKADVPYTPTAGTKLVKIRPDAAIQYKLSSATNKKDTVGFPIAANANEQVGIATRSGVGVKVDKIVFTGSSTATKTIYIQEQ